MAREGRGRPTLFKKDGPDIHGRISAAAGDKFERARKRLATMAKEINNWSGKISDGDVVEYLASGEVATRLKLKGEA